MTTCDSAVIKVLHVINSLYSAGGAERQLLLSIRSLDASRFKSYICCLEKPQGLADEAARMGIPVFSLNTIGKPQWPVAILRLRRLIKSLDIDLVHTSLFDADMVGGIASKLAARPAISTFAGLVRDDSMFIDNPGLGRMKFAATQKISAFVYRFCFDRHIAVSNWVKESAIRHLRIPEVNVSVIHRALPDGWTETSDDGSLNNLRAELGIQDAYPVLSHVGRMVHPKGQRYLIESMPEIVAQFPRTQLLMIGEGPFQKSLVSLAQRLGVYDHITFLGRRNDVSDVLTVSGIFVFPSLYEGCPNALMEALALEKTCVASRIPSVEEIADNDTHAKLVPIRSPHALAKAVIWLADHPQEAKAMAARASKMVQSRFTGQHVGRELMKVYEGVLTQEYSHAEWDTTHTTRKR